MNYILILFGLAALYYLGSVVIGLVMTRKFIFSKNKSPEYTYAKCKEFGDYTDEEFASYRLEDFSLTSEYGYTLRGVCSPGSDPTKTVVFVHGHTWTWHGQVKYFPLYRARGYNIVAYNHRNHGDSGGENCTAGYFEKYDLKKVTEWARERFPETRILGLMGESLGAATTCQALPLVEGLSFAHVDCPYEDMLGLYDYLLSIRHIPRAMRNLAERFSISYTKRKAGFDPHEVSPGRSIMERDVPMLFIHGDADTYVPTRMSVSMYERRKEYADTTLVLIHGAKHAQSIRVDRETYVGAVETFLERVEQR